VNAAVDAAFKMWRDRAELAEQILLRCATDYYVASGLVQIDGHDGYGSLREARKFIEDHGSIESKAELDRWRRPHSSGQCEEQ
jgi:hypothetical protein